MFMLGLLNLCLLKLPKLFLEYAQVKGSKKFTSFSIDSLICPCIYFWPKFLMSNFIDRRILLFTHICLIYFSCSFCDIIVFVYVCLLYLFIYAVNCYVVY